MPPLRKKPARRAAPLVLLQTLALRLQQEQAPGLLLVREQQRLQGQALRQRPVQLLQPRQALELPPLRVRRLQPVAQPPELRPWASQQLAQLQQG